MPSRSAFKTLLAVCAAAALPAFQMPAQAQAPDVRPIFFNSMCKYPVRVLIHHKDSRNEHHPHGWYVFEPYEENRLQDNDVVLRQVVGEDLYYFAETVRRSGVPELVWGGGDATTMFQGVRYSLRRASLFVNQQGQLELQLTCTAN